MIFRESGLEFNFLENQWQWVIQYDTDVNYENISKAVQSTKAIDFLDIDADDRLIMIEVKNMRKHRIENKPRMAEGAEELTTEVAQKIRDSIAGIIGAARNATNDPEQWLKAVDILINKNVALFLWLEEDISSKKNEKEKKEAKTKAIVYADNLKRKLKWLTTQVAVVSIKTGHPIGGLDVNYLADQPDEI